MSVAPLRPAPCPNCGSLNIRWRNRRIYDYVLVWSRGAFEYFLRALGLGHPIAYGDPRRPEMWIYGRARNLLDERASFMVPRRYWRCRGCRQRGEVFEHTLDNQRRGVALIEDELRQQRGSVSDPVDRDGFVGREQERRHPPVDARVYDQCAGVRRWRGMRAQLMGWALLA